MFIVKIFPDNFLSELLLHIGSLFHYCMQSLKGHWALCLKKKYFLQIVVAVHCSYNADMLPDLLAENTSGLWTIYIANVLHGFNPIEPLPRSPLAVPHSCAFINLLEDYAAGILNYFVFSFFLN